MRILAALLLCPALASAQTLMTGFVTHHSRGEFCEANHGIGYRQDTGALAGWGVGVYRNSVCKTSAYVAREFINEGLSIGPATLHAGVVLGAVTGYRYAVVPVILPELVVMLGRAEIAAVVQPFDFEWSPRFIGLQARWRFGQ